MILKIHMVANGYTVDTYNDAENRIQQLHIARSPTELYEVITEIAKDWVKIEIERVS